MGGKMTRVLLSFLFILPSYSFEKSICNGEDLRVESKERRVGRAQRPGDKSGCTIAMIGRTCAISAGHCHHRLENVHFNVPYSTDDGEIRPSEKSDIYPVIQESIIYRENGKGDDFAVFRIGKNGLTNEFPGDTNGFFSISFREVFPGEQIRLISYGADRDAGEEYKTYTQQTSYSSIFESEETYLTYQADTWGGSSGAPVLDENDSIIGIHTHGDCDVDGGRNSGTNIHNLREFKEAVINCLKWEFNNL